MAMGQPPAVTLRRSINLEARQVDVLRELDRLRVEIEELRASRERLVSAADADRRTIERDLHDGVHQYLVALAVTLQLAGQATDSDLAAAKTLLEEMGRDVQQALDETALLAQRIYPATLEAGGLAALLRSAAVNAGVPASVDVVAGPSYPPEVGLTVYLCWLVVLGRSHGGNRAAITVREEGGALTFEFVEDGVAPEAEFDGLRDRVEALGGRLAIRSERGRGTRVSASLPISR